MAEKPNDWISAISHDAEVSVEPGENGQVSLVFRDSGGSATVVMSRKQFTDLSGKMFNELARSVQEVWDQLRKWVQSG